MLSSRAFVAWLLAAAVVGGGLALLVGAWPGLVLGGIVVAGAVAQLPRPMASAGDRPRRSAPSALEEDIWWAVEWAEPLVPYDLQVHGGLVDVAPPAHDQHQDLDRIPPQRTVDGRRCPHMMVRPEKPGSTPDA